MKDAAQQSEFYRQIGDSIRKYRTRRKLSQDALAQLVGLTRTSLTNIENGRQHPPLHIICDIAEQLEVDVTVLLPRPLATPGSLDADVLARSHVRDAHELAFIETAIGMKGKESHGNTTAKN